MCGADGETWGEMVLLEMFVRAIGGATEEEESERELKYIYSMG